jgi:2-polyprenyl-3-methyl-5-hydroxy-6-metoxy-1,4-benzoquinol methylase
MNEENNQFSFTRVVLKANSYQCFVCAKLDFFSELFVGSYELSKCKHCGMVIINGSGHCSYDDYGSYLTDENVSRVNAILKKRRALFKGLAKKYGKADILDFGSGAGFFLEAARQYGFNVTGVEVSERLSRFAKNTFGIEMFKSLDELTGNFDAIFMDNVIEHIAPDVHRAIMLRLISMLRPQGVLVGWTPNFNSLNVRFLRENDPVISPPQHLCYFTPTTLDAYLQSIGLKRKLLVTEGFAIHSFFRPEKHQYSFIERPNGELQRITSLFLRAFGRAVSKVLGPAGLGSQLEFRYER